MWIMEFKTATVLAQLGTISYEVAIPLLKPSSELCLLRFTRPKNCPNLRLVTSSVSASLDRRLLILHFSHSTKLSNPQFNEAFSSIASQGDILTATPSISSPSHRLRHAHHLISGNNCIRLSTILRLSSITSPSTRHPRFHFPAYKSHCPSQIPRATIYHP